MFGQLLVEVSNLTPRSTDRTVVTVSEDANVSDRMLVQSRVEHSDLVAKLLHGPFVMQTDALG